MNPIVVPMLSIITPTFNRSFQLKNVYNSLLKNNNNCFEWIIVDDGSDDSTGKEVTKWMSEKKINIRYVFQDNAGVTCARERGEHMVNTEWMTWIDSDDIFKEHAVDRIFECITKFSEELNANKCAGLLFPLEINGKYEITTGRHTLTEQYYKYGLSGEFMAVMKTNIHNRFGFPKFRGERFVTESVLFRKIDYYYYYLCLNIPIVIRRYLNDGLTSNINSIHDNNEYGTAYSIKTDCAYGRHMGVLKRAQAYTDYNNYLHNCLQVEEDIFPELRVPLGIKIFSQVFYNNFLLSFLRSVLVYPFPYKKIPPKSEIVLYGAGNIGQAYMRQISVTNYCNIKLWVDMMHSVKHKMGLNVKAPEALSNLKEFDYIVLAIKSQKERKKVYEQLIELGIATYKIID